MYNIFGILYRHGYDVLGCLLACLFIYESHVTSYTICYLLTLR